MSSSIYLTKTFLKDRPVFVGERWVTDGHWFVARSLLTPKTLKNLSSAGARWESTLSIEDILDSWLEIPSACHAEPTEVVLSSLSETSGVRLFRAVADVNRSRLVGIREDYYRIFGNSTTASVITPPEGSAGHVLTWQKKRVGVAQVHLNQDRVWRELLPINDLVKKGSFL